MRPVPNRAHDARRKAESAALNEDMGKFRTGPHKNKADKRTGTKKAAIAKAIKAEGY
jgi:hypothetical protein